jgi:hypothetical protein
MGDPQTTFWQEAQIFLTKALGWLVWITIGVAAKLAFDSRAKQLTKRDVIIKSILSIFCGYLAAVLCDKYGYEEWGKIVVPVATLLGEGVIMYVMTNWKKWIDPFLPPLFRQVKKKEDEV